MSKTKKPKKKGWLTKAGDFGREVNERLSELGLEQAAGMLAEGFCPVCKSRSATEPPFELPEDLRPAPTIVNCHSCKLHWRSGENPTNNLDWIEYTQHNKHLTLAMCLNPPPDPPDEDDDEWFWENYGDED